MIEDGKYGTAEQTNRQTEERLGLTAEAVCFSKYLGSNISLGARTLEIEKVKRLRSELQARRREPHKKSRLRLTPIFQIIFVFADAL